MLKLLKYAFLTAIAVLLASCGDDSAPTSELVSYDIMCLRSVDSSGSVFTLTKPDSETVITYNTPQRLPENRVSTGDRILLAYSCPNHEPYTSGVISIKGYSTINNLTIKKIDLDTIPSWNAEPVYLTTAWRSESFLNLRVDLPYDTTPRALALGVDVKTLDSSTPQCYLIHYRDEKTPTFDRNYYLSIDIEPLTKWSGATGFDLNINDKNLHINKINFKL